MKRILAQVGNKIDATAYYRVISPFSKLVKSGEIQLDIEENFFPQLLEFYDAVFMQRPAGNQCLLLAKWANNLGLPVWCDFDDNLFDVPFDNPSYDLYKKEKQSIKEIIQRADIVTVTTKKLKEIYEPYNRKIQIIPNAWDFDISESKGRNMFTARNKTIIWRGSPTHQKDVMSVKDEIIDLSKKHKDWKWIFIGDKLWWLTENMHNCFWIKYLPIYEYFYEIKKLKPSLFIAPLLVNDFNKCKSNIVFLEATYAGALTLTSDLDEFPCYKYTNNFTEQVEMIMNSEVSLLHEKAFELVVDKYSLEHINEKRRNIINDL